MDLIKEYSNQNTWRDWERYLEKLPLNQNQIVYDLGCSIGTVSHLLAKKTKQVTGFDNDQTLIVIANKEKENNCKFVDADIITLDPNKLEKCDGVWISFVLAYVENPDLFIANWTKCLNEKGWFAIVDIDDLFSGHLPENNKFLKATKEFERESEKNNTYDFKIGGKIKALMEKNGLEIIIAEEDWYDIELNFSGNASKNITANWRARLERMVQLKNHFGENYGEFCDTFINSLSSEEHFSKGCVKFYVGIKKCSDRLD